MIAECPVRRQAEIIYGVGGGECLCLMRQSSPLGAETQQ